MATLKFKRGSTGPSGLTLGEPAWDYSNNKLFVGVTSSAIWVGAEIDGSTGLGTSQTKIPTQNAVKIYVDSKVSVGVTGPTGPTGAAGVTGATGPTGAIPTDYVISVNGTTGAITNVAKTNVAQTFTQQQSFTSGLSLSSPYSLPGITLNSTSSGHYLSISQNQIKASSYTDPQGGSLVVNAGNIQIGDVSNVWNAPSARNFYIEAETGVSEWAVLGGSISLSADQVNITATPDESYLNSGQINLTSYTGGINLTTVNSGGINLSSGGGELVIQQSNPSEYLKIFGVYKTRIGDWDGCCDGMYIGLNEPLETGVDANAGGFYVKDWYATNPKVFEITNSIGASGSYVYIRPNDGLIVQSGATFTGNIYAPNIVTSVNGQTGAVTVSGGGAGICYGWDGKSVIINKDNSLNGYANTQENVIIGVSAGYNLNDGLSNTIIGYGADVASDAQYAIAIGYKALATDIGDISIGSTFNVNTTTIYGGNVNIVGNLSIQNGSDVFLSSGSVIQFPDGSTQSVAFSTNRGYTFTQLQRFSAGISASGATFTGNISAPNIVNSINGATGAITNVARLNEGNTFSVRQVMNAGITSANLYVSSGTTFNGSAYFASTATVENSTGVLTLKKANTIGNESATLVLTSYDFNPDPFTSTLTATTNPTVNTVHTLPSVSGTLLNTASNYVSSFNGRIGAVQGVSAAVAGTGISVSGATGSVTITNIGVLSVNGQTGNVTITSSGSDGVTGIIAGSGISVSGPTGNVTITNTGVLSINGSTGAVTNVNAETVTITNINTNATYYPLFSTGTGATALYGDFVTVPLTYNPSTGSFQSRKFRAQGTVAFIEADGQAATISLNDGTNLSTMSSIDFASSAPIPFSIYSANESVTIAGPNGVHFADIQYGEIEAWGYTFPTANGLSGQGLYTRGDGQLYWNNAVFSVNGQTGDVTVTGGSSGVTGIVAGTGIAVSGPTGNVTITNIGVLSVNGSTGAVTISGSGISRFISSISTDTTAGSTASTDYVYIATAGLTLTIPTAVSNLNLYTIKSTTTSTVNIFTTSSQTIDGATAYYLNKQYQAIGLISDGSNWSIV